MPAPLSPRSYEIYWENDRSPDIVIEEMAMGMYDTIMHQLTLMAEMYAIMIASWMKENAVWQDRSGDARKALWADVFVVGTSIIIMFGHGPTIYYGWYLEFKNEGRYQIVGPALSAFYPQVFSTAQFIVGRFK